MISHGLEDTLVLSHGTVGFSLQEIELLLTVKGLSKRPISALVVRRIQRTLEIRAANEGK